MSVVTPEAPADATSPLEQDPSRGARAMTEADLLCGEIAALRRQNQMLRETLDTIEGSVVVYDEQRYFLYANAIYHALYPHLPPDEEMLGERFEDLLRRSIAAGMMEDPAALTDPEAYIARRIATMEERRAMPRDVFNTRPGRKGMQPKTGRWYLIRSRRTPRGNDVTLRVDITLQKWLQRGLETARHARRRRQTK